MSSSKSLSTRQRYWLAHLQTCIRQGASLAAYASAQGLKVGALYEAKSRLRRQGAWPPPGARFVRVQAAGSSVTDAPHAPLLRVSLRNRRAPAQYLLDIARMRPCCASRCATAWWWWRSPAVRCR